jgi:hypothetical protein
LWGYFLVFLATYFTEAWTLTRSFDWSLLENVSATAIGAWVPPSLFGIWVGMKQLDPLFRARIIPLGLLVGLASFIGAAVFYHVDLGGSIWNFRTIRWELLFIALPAILLYVSGALIGNAWQRRRIGRISGTTPASPIARNRTASRPHSAEWTPRKQAILGWSGTIIAAVLSLVGTIVTALSG